MSSTTTNLGLVKMASGETIGQWSDANNGSGGNLDKIDTAVGNLNSQLEFQRNDTFVTNGGQFAFRTLSDKSAILFNIRLPKECASNVNSFSVSITTSSSTWFSGSSIGSVQSGATAGNISLRGRRVLQFSVPTSGTISENGFGICELNATITFTA